MNVKETQNAVTQITLPFTSVVEAMNWAPTEASAAGGDGLRGKELHVGILHIILPAKNQHRTYVFKPSLKAQQLCSFHYCYNRSGWFS